MKTIGLIFGALALPFRSIVIGMAVAAVIAWRDCAEGYAQLWDWWRR